MITINEIKIVKNPSPELVEQCSKWPAWSCGVKRFDWHYTETEMLLLIEGRVEISNLDGTGKVVIEKGDYAELPNGLECVWNVTADLKKYYGFKDGR